jgi:rare lipoprotein A
MYSVHCAGIRRFNPSASRSSVTHAGRFVRVLSVVVGGALLAACAQSTQQASIQHDRVASRTNQRVALARRHIPAVAHKNAGEAPTAAHGVASFYTEGTQTASGEKFDTHDLTAAHPTLPFGTRVRVTNVATGKSVTVRVNDRGPYVRGRIVDVSYSAAESLGMVGKGVANVKLDVVQ